MTEVLIRWFEEWGTWGILFSLGCSIVIHVLGFIPSVVVTGANVVVWGPLWGGVLSWIAEVIGCSIAFLFYRYGKERWSVTKKLDWRWIHSFDQWSRIKQFSSLLVARIMPVLPSGMINLLGAFTHMYTVDFVIATAIGKIPSNLLEVLISYGFLQISQSELNWLLFLITALICGLLFWKKEKKILDKQK
jgi:uncharacterized membrane protein YdjX (TVP38/TMEM64 family)